MTRAEVTRTLAQMEKLLEDVSNAKTVAAELELREQYGRLREQIKPYVSGMLPYRENEHVQ